VTGTDVTVVTTENRLVKENRSLMLTVSEKKLSQLFFITSKLITNFHPIWHTDLAINAWQRDFELSTSPDMCTHATL